MSAVLTICRGFTAINDETTAEPRRSWRWHCGLCRTSTAVAPRLRCDGGITDISHASTRPTALRLVRASRIIANNVPGIERRVMRVEVG